MLQTILMLCGLLIANGTQNVVYANHYPQQADQTRQVDSNIKNVVRERGVLESRKSVALRNRTGNSTAIIELVSEGSMVKKGDLIVRLDDSMLQEQLAKQTISMINVKAELVQAEAAIALLKSEFEAANELARLRVDLAALNHQRLLGDGGELELELRKAQSALNVAQQRLALAEQSLQSLKKSDGNTASQEQEMKLQIADAKATLEAAQAEKRLLEGPERAYRVALLKLEMRDAELALNLTQRNFNSQASQAQATLQAMRDKFNLEQEKLGKVQQQLESCQIYAPQNGKVAYAHIRDRRGRNEFVIEPGAIVRDRQKIVILPNMNQLQLKVMVKEANITQVRVGQPATIRLDAFPDQVFEGKVVHMKKYPEPSGWSGGDIRHYAVAVSIKNPPDNLKLGLTAIIDINTSEQR